MEISKGESHMKRNNINIRANYLANNSITLDELNKLSEDNCVRFNRNYFHFLLTTAQGLEIQDKSVLEIFSKYLKLEKMYCFVHKTLHPKEFYLMEIEEAKKLVNTMNVPLWKNSILKSNVEKTRLRESQTDLQDLYRRSKEGTAHTEIQKKLLKEIKF